MASSLFVVFPMAETTTIGFRSTRARTIDATRSMAAADSTDVPPNFITIIGRPPRKIGPGVPGPYQGYRLGPFHPPSRDSCSAGPRAFCGDLRPFADVLIENPQVSRTNRGSPALQLAFAKQCIGHTRLLPTVGAGHARPN